MIQKRLVLPLLLLLLRQDGQLPELLFHRPLGADEAAKLLCLGAGQRHSPLQHLFPGTDRCVRSAAEPAGHGQLIPLPIENRRQSGAAAVALHLRAGGLQGEYGTGFHDGLSAFGAEIAKGPHLLAHGRTSPFSLPKVREGG